MHRAQGRIHGQLLIVRSQPVAMRVGIGKHAGLQHFVRREADARHVVRWAEGGLLDLGKIVVRIAVQLDHPDRNHWVILVRPHLGQVEGIVGGLLGIQLRHDLDLQVPAREVAPVDRAKKVFLIALAGLADYRCRLSIGQKLLPLRGLEMELHPEPLTGGIPKAVGVRSVAVHEAWAEGDAAVGHENGDLMQALRRQRPEVPHGRVRAQVGFGMPLLRMDKVGKLQRIANEKDRGVVAHQIPVSFLGVVLHGEAAHVAFGVGRACLTGNVGEAEEARRLLANL